MPHSWDLKARRLPLGLDEVGHLLTEFASFQSIFCSIIIYQSKGLAFNTLAPFDAAQTVPEFRLIALQLLNVQIMTGTILLLPGSCVHYITAGAPRRHSKSPCYSYN